MATLNHTCDQCDSQFTIRYDEEVCEDSPQYCPFCSEMIIEFEQVDDDE
jgi:hypothetical protein